MHTVLEMPETHKAYEFGMGRDRVRGDTEGSMG